MRVENILFFFIKSFIIKNYESNMYIYYLKMYIFIVFVGLLDVVLLNLF